MIQHWPVVSIFGVLFCIVALRDHFYHMGRPALVNSPGKATRQ